MKKLMLAVVAFVGLLGFYFTSMADGEHRTHLTFTNDSSGYICVFSYNGGDSACSVPHKAYYLEAGESKTVKCHGEGHKRCKIELERTLHGGHFKSLCNTSKSGSCNTVECPKTITEACSTKVKKNDNCHYSTTVSSETGAILTEHVSCDDSNSTIEYTIHRVG